MHGVRTLIETGFLFLRHGESESNVRGLIGGATDYQLTDQGRQQARDAGALLRDRGVTRIFTSPLTRALETAQIAADAMGGAPVEVVEGLRERNFGVWEGQPISVLVRGVTPEGGESHESFEARITRSLNAITAPPTALMVAHAGVFRVLRRNLAGADVPERARNAHPYAFDPSDNGGDWRVEAL